MKFFCHFEIFLTFWEKNLSFEIFLSFWKFCIVLSFLKFFCNFEKLSSFKIFCHFEIFLSFWKTILSFCKVLFYDIFIIFALSVCLSLSLTLALALALPLFFSISFYAPPRRSIRDCICPSIRRSVGIQLFFEWLSLL